MKVALITGASGGIGKSFALEIAKEGYEVILVSRNAEQLNQVAVEIGQKYGTKSYVLPLDLAVPYQAKVLYQKIREFNLSVDVLVNNAGVGYLEEFYLAPPERISDMLYLNMVTLTELTHLFLPDMVTKRQGMVINISSTAAFQPGPGMAVYYASKSYVLSFTEALHKELQNKKIHVTAVCPGPVVTNFFKVAQMEGILLRSKNIPIVLSPEYVAKIGWKAAKKNKRVFIPGIFNWLLAILSRMFPNFLILPLVAKMNQKAK